MQTSVDRANEATGRPFEVETLVPVDFNATSLLDGWSPDERICAKSSLARSGQPQIGFKGVVSRYLEIDSGADPDSCHDPDSDAD